MQLIAYPYTSCGRLAFATSVWPGCILLADQLQILILMSLKMKRQIQKLKEDFSILEVQG